MSSQPDQSRRWRFPRRRRLTRPDEFNRVYGQGRRTRQGPLVVHALPNACGHARLGLSVSKKVGNAVDRNRVKRRLRDAFRHLQHQLPGSYDLVITVQPHDVRSRPDCRTLLQHAAEKLHRKWTQSIENTSADRDSQPDS